MKKEYCIQSEAYDRLKQTLCSKIVYLNKMVQNLGDDIVKSLNLPIEHSQFPVLMSLYFLNELSQQQIADAVGRDKSSIQRTLAVLAKKEIVDVVSHISDKRKNIVRLTDYGKQICGTLIEQAEQMDQNMFKCLSKAELDTLQQIFQKIIEHNQPVKKF